MGQHFDYLSKDMQQVVRDVARFTVEIEKASGELKGGMKEHTAAVQESIASLINMTHNGQERLIIKLREIADYARLNPLAGAESPSSWLKQNKTKIHEWETIFDSAAQQAQGNASKLASYMTGADAKADAAAKKAEEVEKKKLMGEVPKPKKHIYIAGIRRKNPKAIVSETPDTSEGLKR